MKNIPCTESELIQTLFSFALYVGADAIHSLFFLPGPDLIFLGAHSLLHNHNRKMNALSSPHAILKH